MTTASQRTVQVLEQIVKPVPLGTNLALLHLMWAIISGAFLPGRGAVHAALNECGFTLHEIRRCWRALRTGKWHIYELLGQFREVVSADAQWQASRCGSWRPVAVDLTTIWRPQLQNWLGKMFHRLAGKKKTGIGYGLIADIGTIEAQRVPLLRAIVRGETDGESETSLQRRTLRQVAKMLQEDEVSIHDAGVSLSEIHEAGIAHYLARQRSNITGRRNKLPPYRCGRHHKFGEIVRPLARKRAGRKIVASPPNCVETFLYQGR